MISNVVKNSWNWNLANFRDLVLILLEAATGSALLKNGVLLKILQYTQGNAFARVSFYAATLLKKRLCTGIFVWIFARCLRTPFSQSTSGWLLVFYNSRLLYILQLNIAGKFQVERSYYSGKKNHPYISRILQI